VIPTRLLAREDVPELTELLRLNREFLAPWEPVREDDYFTEAGQLAVVEEALGRYDGGSSVPHVIVDEAGRMVGRITLNGIVRGPFLSCSVGYWVNEADNGRGFATGAVADIKRVAFKTLGLHRIQAETVFSNVRSRRVLQRNGFVRIGMAPEYLHIAGRWQDHELYQVVNPEFSHGS